MSAKWDRRHSQCPGSAPTRGGRMRSTATLVTLILLALLTTASCSQPQTTPEPPAPGTVPYTPLFAGTGTEQEPEGTMAGDFTQACAATTVGEAATLWEAFLATHASEDVEMEDGFHWRRVEAARFELVRVYYLLGKIEEADALLTDLSSMM